MCKTGKVYNIKIVADLIRSSPPLQILDFFWLQGMLGFYLEKKCSPSNTVPDTCWLLLLHLHLSGTNWHMVKSFCSHLQKAVQRTCTNTAESSTFTLLQLGNKQWKQTVQKNKKHFTIDNSLRIKKFKYIISYSIRHGCSWPEINY